MIREKLQKYLKEIIGKLYPDAGEVEVGIDRPKSNFGDYATNVAFVLAGNVGKKPPEIATEIADELASAGHEEIEKVEATGPFVNISLSNAWVQSQVADIANDEAYGRNKDLKGKKLMVEFTDANIMKPFHIGHLMSNAIGESISRLLEASGAEVKRANYYGDIGLHVAKAIWGMAQAKSKNQMPDEDASLEDKAIFLGKAYATGAQAYEADAKDEIDEINKQVYDASDPELNELYKKGKEWSESYVAGIHTMLGTKFDFQYPESSVTKDGVAYVEKGLEQGVFEKSDGAVIFKGEQYGLHTRVFLTQKGLPLYEAKDLGLNPRKYQDYKFDHSIIITGSEQNEYFKVVLKALSMLEPEVASKTEHIGHGLMQLATGKMSSRMGNVVTGESLIREVHAKMREKVQQNEDLSDEEKETVARQVAVGAIKYSILRQGIGQNISFDFDTSLAFEGDSGPYVQYTYARLNAILRKAGGEPKAFDTSALSHELELALMKQLFDFPEVVKGAAHQRAPHTVVNYVFSLANTVNEYYEKVRVLAEDVSEEQKNARLALIATIARVIKDALWMLGIEAPSRI